MFMDECVTLADDPGHAASVALRMAEVQRSILNLPMDLTVGVRGSLGYEKALATRQRKVNFLTSMLLTRLNVTRARMISGVKVEELSRWRSEDSHFKSTELSLYEDVLDLAEEKLFNAVEEGDLKAVTFLLRTKGKARGYAEKIELEHGVQDFEKALLDARKRTLSANNPVGETLDEISKEEEAS